MADPSRRANDPAGMDSSGLREPVEITLSGDDLARTITVGRTRAVVYGVLAGMLTAMAVSATLGLVITGVVTKTVRKDIGHAAIFNCRRTNQAASVGPALREFLTTDATFNAQLAGLDVRSAQIDRDLSLQIRRLGPVLPPNIARDYFAQSAVFQELAGKRAQVAALWAGQPRRGNRKRPRSLASDVQVLTQAHCDKILLP